MGNNLGKQNDPRRIAVEYGLVLPGDLTPEELNRAVSAYFYSLPLKEQTLIRFGTQQANVFRKALVGDPNSSPDWIKRFDQGDWKDFLDDYKTRTLSIVLVARNHYTLLCGDKFPADKDLDKSFEAFKEHIRAKRPVLTAFKKANKWDEFFAVELTLFDDKTTTVRRLCEVIARMTAR